MANHLRPVPALPSTPSSPKAPEADQEPLWRHLVGDVLRDRRHGRGETLGEVARRAGLSPQYLSEIERGRKEPSSEVVRAIGRALELTQRDLLSDLSERLDVLEESSSPDTALLAA